MYPRARDATAAASRRMFFRPRNGREWFSGAGRVAMAVEVNGLKWFRSRDCAAL
jgi:hypothetical protein